MNQFNQARTAPTGFPHEIRDSSGNLARFRHHKMSAALKMHPIARHVNLQVLQTNLIKKRVLADAMLNESIGEALKTRRNPANLFASRAVIILPLLSTLNPFPVWLGSFRCPLDTRLSSGCVRVPLTACRLCSSLCAL